MKYKISCLVQICTGYFLLTYACKCATKLREPVAWWYLTLRRFCLFFSLDSYKIMNMSNEIIGLKWEDPLETDWERIYDKIPIYLKNSKMVIFQLLQSCLLFFPLYNFYEMYISNCLNAHHELPFYCSECSTMSSSGSDKLTYMDHSS